MTPLIALLCAPEAPPAVKQPQPRKKPSWAKGKKRERSFVLLVAANSELPIDEITELRVEAQTLSSLQTRVAEQLGLSEPVLVCPRAELVEEAAPLRALAELGAQDEVSVWPVRCFPETSLPPPQMRRRP